MADPPWPFGDKLPGATRGAAKHYALMKIDDIAAFPLPPLADDCALFLWRVSSQVEEAYRVARAWGFRPKTEIVWLKRRPCGRCKGGTAVKRIDRMTGSGCIACNGRKRTRWFGMGRITRAEHETCIVAVRGRPRVLDKAVRSTFEALGGRHSAKPDEFYKLVERLYAGPRAELFARVARPGWSQSGLELDASAV